MRTFRVLVALAVAGAAVGTVTAGAGASRTDHASVCTGTVASPGVLAGTYHSDVVVQGVCFVNGGAANVQGNLIVAPGAALNATFALNDVAGTGTSSLTVRGNLLVQNNGTLVLGCEPNFSTCSDDPNNVLTGSNHVQGNLTSTQPLGVVVHTTTIDGNVIEAGGGGGAFSGPGANCTPTGVFAAFGSPVFSDYEDNTIGGSLNVFGLQTCWLGSLRNTVAGNIVDINNTMADPDAGEVLQNTVRGNLVCIGNSPAVQYGDSGASPNIVGGNAVGQCGFDVLSPDPNYPNGDGTGGPQPISVKADNGHHRGDHDHGHDRYHF